MTDAPDPPNEARRLAALHRYGLADTGADPVFDDIVFLAAQACRTPIAYLSIVEADHVWFKAAIGLAVERVPREGSFCAHSILVDGVDSIADARLDPRFAGSPYVTGPPGMRYYAGMSVRAPGGEAIGALCVADTSPREISESQARALAALARQAERQLELRRYLGESAGDVAAAIAERERAQEELRHTVSLLAATLDASRDGILVVDRDGKITAYNRRFTELWHIPEEVVATHDDDRALDFVCDQLTDPEEFLAKVREVYKSAEAESHDLIRFKDGRVIERESRPQRLAGHSVGRVWSFRDVTTARYNDAARSAAYRISEAAQAASGITDFLALVHAVVRETMPAENFYVALYDAATDSLSFPYFVDRQDPPPVSVPLGRGLTAHVIRNGRALFASPEVFADLVERGEVELLGSPSLEWLGVPLVTPAGTIGALVVQSYEEGQRYRREDLALLGFVSGQIAMAIQRKRSDEERVAGEARMRLVMSQLPAVLWTVDRELRVVSSEGGGADSWGVESGVTVGRTLPEQLGTEDPEPLPIAAHRRALAGESATYEATWGARHHAVRVDPLRDAEGVVVGAIGLAIDVTERWELEERLRQSAKMEGIGQLAGGIAHDFNNLLTSILGNAELLRARFGADDPALEEVEQIEHAGARAAALTQQLLVFSRRQVVERKVVSLNALVAEAGGILRRLIGEDVELRIEAGSDVRAVLADPNQLLQVVLNLAVNARDAMPEGGLLTVATSRVELAAPRRFERFEIPPGHYSLLRVQDTGVGMSAETLRHLFEPFWTTKAKGTGLGLSTVYGIVKRSRGFVTVTSAIGRGTLFEVFLPEVDEEGARDGAAAGPATAFAAPATILVVEDEPAARKLIGRMLEARGYRVLTAENGIRALELEEGLLQRVDLLVTDVVMPGMSGPQLARLLAERRPGLPVLFLSGYPEDALGERGVLHEGTAFLRKPFSSLELAAKVNDVLGPAPGARTC